MYTKIKVYPILISKFSARCYYSFIYQVRPLLFLSSNSLHATVLTSYYVCYTYCEQNNGHSHPNEALKTTIKQAVKHQPSEKMSLRCKKFHLRRVYFIAAIKIGGAKLVHVLLMICLRALYCFLIMLFYFSYVLEFKL